MKKIFGIVFGLTLFLATFAGTVPAKASTADPAWLIYKNEFCSGNLVGPIVHGTTGVDTKVMAQGDWTGPNHTGTQKASCYFGLEGGDIINLPQGDLFDYAIGGPDNDVITSYGGNDTFDGNDGSDSLYGNNGSDQIYGGNGSDYIEGNADSDILWGGEECDETNWFLFSAAYWGSDPQPNYQGWCGEGDGPDTILGGNGDDFLYDSNSDVVSDGAVDIINGGGGYDDCTGGPEDTFTNCDVIHIVPNGTNP